VDLGPVNLSHISGQLKLPGSQPKQSLALTIGGWLTLAEKSLSYVLRGTVSFDWSADDPCKLAGTSNVVLFHVVPLGQQQETIDVGTGTIKQNVDIGGALSAVVSVTGDADIHVPVVRPVLSRVCTSQAKTVADDIKVQGDLKVFRVSLAQAGLTGNLGTGRLL